MLSAMSRPLRIKPVGSLYHFTSRGDRREAIYRDDQDRLTGDPLGPRPVRSGAFPRASARPLSSEQVLGPCYGIREVAWGESDRRMDTRGQPKTPVLVSSD